MAIALRSSQIWLGAGERRGCPKEEREELRRYRVFVIAFVLLMSSVFLASAPPVAANGTTQTFEWYGWWIDDSKVTVATVGDIVTAKLRISNEPSGHYRIRIMRDIAWWIDSEVVSIEFDYDGGDHVYSLDFIPTIATDQESTRGYHVDVYIAGFLGWSELWTLPSFYPPRLRVYESIPAWGYYHSYDEIETGLLSLEQSGIARVETIGTSIEGRNIWAIKISDEPDIEDANEPDVLFVGLHHAREWISVEVSYYLAYNLVHQYWSDPDVKMLVDNSEVWIIPVLNPDGLEYSQACVWDPELDDWSRFWRKNRADNGDGTHGADLNRNYGYMWGTPTYNEVLGIPYLTSSPFTDDDVYWGQNAFSEPETSAVKNLVMSSQRNFKAVLSYHSYSQYVLYPWGVTTDSTPDASIMETLAEEMADQIFRVHGKQYTPQQSSSMYECSGDLTDWAYAEMGIPAFTIELRPGPYPWWAFWEDSKYRFDLPKEEIVPTCEENWPAALYLVRWAILSEGGFMDFEDGVDEAPIRSTIPGMTFTTTMGYDWIHGDIRTGKYNVNPYGSRAYECNSNFFAWLGPNQGAGRIDFIGATAQSISMLTSTAYGTYLDAYDSFGNRVAQSYAASNIWTGTLSELSVSGSNIAYVIVHDSGNYWLIDDLRVDDLLRETSAYQSPDGTSIMQVLDLIDMGEVCEYEFENNQEQFLKILLNWRGSQLGLEIVRPDGSAFYEIDSESPPVRVVVPNAEEGLWKLRVTGIDVPYNEYPFALDVASLPPPPDFEPPEISIETPGIGQAIQDVVDFTTQVLDPSGVDWVTFSVRNPDGDEGTIIDQQFESMSASSVGDDRWQLSFDSALLPDGYYILLVMAADSLGNKGNEIIEFSIRNWAVAELLPATKENKAGRTMPIKFSLRINNIVDPNQPFVINEDLTIRILEKTDTSTNLLQTSTFGTTSRDYRIDVVSEHYITNFKTLRKPVIYLVEIWREGLLIASFEFITVK